MGRLSIVVIALILSSTAAASVGFGVGMNSVNSGRVAPSLVANYMGDTWAIAGSSTGVATPVYFQSSYTINIYTTWSPGDFLGLPLKAGFGGGAMYSERGYRSSTAATIDRKSDVAVGPAFLVSLSLFAGLSLNFDGLFGLGLPTIFGVGQDVVSFSLVWNL